MRRRCGGGDFVVGHGWAGDIPARVFQHLSMPLVLEECYPPARLTSTAMTDDAFAELCTAYPDVVFEMTADHELSVTPPKFTLTGIRNREILAQMDRWAAVDGRGISADASAGFVLPNGARRAPDAFLDSDVRGGGSGCGGEEPVLACLPRVRGGVAVADRSFDCAA